MFNRPRRRLIDLCHEANICTIDVRERFTQRTARQQMSVAEHIHRIDEENIHVTRKLPVLIAIIEDRHLCPEVLDGIASRHGAVRPDEYGYIRQMLGEHKRLVSRRLRIHLQCMSI